MTDNTILHAVNLKKTISTNSLLMPNKKRLLWEKPELKMDAPGLYVVTGRNGCGKSTLLRALLGLVRPDRGEVSWFNQKKVSIRDIGYLPEFPIIPPAAKAGQWLSWLLDLSIEDLKKQSKDLAHYPSLAVEEFLNVPANRLSKGQLQRIQLWACLVNQPKGIVLDEPFSGLDPWARVELAELLLAVIRDGKFILMATHELGSALRQATKESWIIEHSTIQTIAGCKLPE